MSPLGVLIREALADAARRRIVPMIAAGAILSLLLVDNCTSCSPTVTSDGRELEVQQIAGMGGVALMVVLGLWTAVLAGVLASDHLAEPLEDGSAQLLLSRPISRGAFALSRLAGALLLAWATGAVLLSATGALLHMRQGVPWAPALGALFACALASTTVGGLSMAASLVLPRVATALLVVTGVGGMAFLEILARFGAELGGLAGWIERGGPPLAGAMIAALEPWIGASESAADPWPLALRALLWALGSTGLLVMAFRRVELGRG